MCCHLGLFVVLGGDVGTHSGKGSLPYCCGTLDFAVNRSEPSGVCQGGALLFFEKSDVGSRRRGQFTPDRRALGAGIS